MRTTVRLPEDLLERAKRKAAAEGRTLTALIEEGLRAVVSVPPGRTKKRTIIQLPVSRASGGLLPGIDPVKLNTRSEEDEDIERLHRTSSQR